MNKGRLGLPERGCASPTGKQCAVLYCAVLHVFYFSIVPSIFNDSPIAITAAAATALFAFNENSLQSLR